jgi:hypothetical protein
MRGSRPSRRWRQGRPRTAVSGRAEGKQRSSKGARGRRRGEGPGGSFWNFQKSKGPYCKVRFPTDPKP